MTSVVTVSVVYRDARKAPREWCFTVRRGARIDVQCFRTEEEAEAERAEVLSQA